MREIIITREERSILIIRTSQEKEPQEPEGQFAASCEDRKAKRRRHERVILWCMNGQSFPLSVCGKQRERGWKHNVNMGGICKTYLADDENRGRIDEIADPVTKRAPSLQIGVGSCSATVE